MQHRNEAIENVINDCEVSHSPRQSITANESERGQFITRKPSAIFLSLPTDFLAQGKICVANCSANFEADRNLLLEELSKRSLLSIGTSIILLQSLENDEESHFIEISVLSNTSISYNPLEKNAANSPDGSGGFTQFPFLLPKVEHCLKSLGAVEMLDLIIQPSPYLISSADAYATSEKLCVEDNKAVEFVKLCLATFVKKNNSSYNSGVRAMEDEFSVLIAMTPAPPYIAVLYYYFSSKSMYEMTTESAWWLAWKSSVSNLLNGESFDPRSYNIQFYSSHPPSGMTRTLSTAAENASESIATGHLSDAFGDLDTFDEFLDPQEGEFQPYRDILQKRVKLYLTVKQTIQSRFGSLVDFSSGWKIFGFNRITNSENQSGWMYREWLPNAKTVHLTGDFNGWSRWSHPLQLASEEEVDLHSFEYPLNSIYGMNEKDGVNFPKSNSIWWIFVKDEEDGSNAISHRSAVRIQIETKDGEVFDRVPAWSHLLWKNQDLNLFNSIIWDPSEKEQHTFIYPRPSQPSSPKVYEAHIGIAQDCERIGTFNEFTENVLPRIARLGYNILLLCGIQEHKHYGSFGYHISNFFAPSSRYGTPEEFKRLVDSAHRLGISVMMSLPHSHASLNALDGLNQMDGTEGVYFKNTWKRLEEQFHSKFFDYTKFEVLRFLLSNLYFFISEYGIDGFRFERITSMIFHRFGVGKHFSFDYNDYFGNDVNTDALIYLMLANDMMKLVLPDVGITMADEWTCFPLLCQPPKRGGLGFDYRYACEGWQKCYSNMLVHRDEQWDLNVFLQYFTTPRVASKCILSVEDISSERVTRRPLKIALFAWESLYTHTVGGVAPHVTELAAGLHRFGHEVHVFVRSTTTAGAHHVHHGVHYHECPFTLHPSFVIETQNMCNSFMWFMRETEDYMKATFQICHAHDWLAAQILKQCKALGRTCVFTMHSTEFGRCGNNVYSGISKQIRDIESDACHLSDRIICVSNVLADEVSKHYNVHREKIKVIYNGIHSEQYDGYENGGPLKLSYNFDVMSPMFLFVGRLVLQKGPDLLVEAIPYILKFRGDACFVIVGDGHMRRSLEEKVKELNIEYAVKIVGAKSGHELRSLFKACDAVVVPSRNEPFGIVVLEGWSAGKPVVATTCGGPRDFVSHSVDGYLVEPTASSIAWGCCEVMKNFDHSKWMGSRGRVKAAYNFSWDSVATQALDLYYEQLDVHDAAPSLCPLGGTSLASTLMGEAINQHMTVFDNDEHSFRGLALHKMLRLLVLSLAGGGYLNFMGNEFGHPNCVDVPRGGNGHSYANNKRQWHLADDTSLKFKHFELFDACMIRLERKLRWLNTSDVKIIECCNEKKIIAFERGICLFVFNFHPIESYEGYQLGSSFVGPLKLIISTDEHRFGGLNRLDEATCYPRFEEYNQHPHSFKFYLPARTAMIFIPLVEYNENTISGEGFLKDADAYIASLHQWRTQ